MPACMHACLHDALALGSVVQERRELDDELAGKDP